ncbi:hypothetical protein [Rhodocyclus tenuis]|uniref:hypothetical protein n=1 Tax=Rhodocyclus tenuis TaxID=1066 RepID=UPI00190875FC|nr:hypothetical protein [Rhodocyclus tenuis]MBK1681454.1 hypothetical protein [Rhodocyclus tenuis]
MSEFGASASTGMPFLSIPPLATSRVSGCATVEVLDPVSDCWLSDEEFQFTGIDLDQWAHLWLADLDRLSARQLALSARTFAHDAVKRLLSARKSTAKIISAALLPVFEGTCTADELVAARALLAKRLRSRLRLAYEVEAVALSDDRSALRWVRRTDAGACVISDDAQAASGEDLANTSAPQMFPLRTIPSAPEMISQGAGFSGRTADIAKALTWNYRCEIDCELAGQDALALDLNFNGECEVRHLRREASGRRQLFEALACHQINRAALWAAIESSESGDKLTAKAPASGASRALDDFAKLATKVVAAWCEYRWTDDHCGVRAPGADSGLAYWIRLQAEAEQGEMTPTPSALILECARSNDSLVWPDIKAGSESPPAIALTPDTAKGNVRVYRFPQAGDAGRIGTCGHLRLDFSFSSPSVLKVGAACVHASVVRNERLSNPEDRRTNPAFVYRTPAVSFSQDIHPANVIARPIGIGTWSREPGSNPLAAVLADVFATGSRIESFALDICCAFRGDSETGPLRIRAPIAHIPASAGNRRTVVVAQLADAVEDFLAAESAARQRPVLVIGLDLYGSGSSIPLARFSTLVARLIRPRGRQS